MSKLRNLPALCRVANSLRVFNHYEKDILAARETGDPAKDREVTGHAAYLWAQDACRRLRLTVTVTGQENLPKEDGFLVIANHQGYADILSLLIAMDERQIGFIAKDSLEKVPMLGRWIRNIGGLFLKRGNPREAMKSLQEGANRLKQGYNLVIFPEGTRSRETRMRHFKRGSFKMAFKAKVPIVPVTLEGAYHVYEETGVYHPAELHVRIHPYVETADLDRHAQNEAENQIEETIRQALPNPEVLE
ncbi:MAG: lysophospholipid acyltransferase family protein [Eubacterium sp.]